MNSFNSLEQVKNAQILVVDDEPTNIKLLLAVLTNAGFENIKSTQDPKTVLGMLQQTPFDLILLDLNMPDMDGYAVMEQIKAHLPDNLPAILILTAQHLQTHKQRALDGGANDYVTKPFDGNELLSRVRNLLEVQLAQKYSKQQNQLLEEMVAKRTKDLASAHQALYDSRMQIVRKLGLAAEYRDNETGLHIIRMSKMAAALGEAAGMKETETKLLLNASPMHDIGKIGIPDKVLLKPGKLNAEEWEIMKTHAQIGADILATENSDLLGMAHDIALTHHEKFDGSGYPNKLIGKNIPLVGRITAIADVFDALTSERPYKKAWPIDEAIDYIKDQKGQHFDPELVDIFLSIIDHIIYIREKHSEPE